MSKKCAMCRNIKQISEFRKIITKTEISYGDYPPFAEIKKETSRLISLKTCQDCRSRQRNYNRDRPKPKSQPYVPCTDYIKCECSKIVSVANINRHEQSQYHKRYVKTKQDNGL